MKKKIVILFTLILIIVLAACSGAQAQEADEPLTLDPIWPTINITAAEAEDLAIHFIGGGELISLELTTYEGSRTFEIAIRFEDFLYDVSIDLQTGDVIRLRSNRSLLSDERIEDETALAEHEPTTHPLALAKTATQTTTPIFVEQSHSPQSSPHPTSSTTTTISREQAAEIALAFMPGTLIEVDHDFEHGRTVWYVAIRSGGRIHEIYVDQQTGEIVYHESYRDD